MRTRLRWFALSLWLFILLGNLVVWSWFNQPVREIDWTGTFQGLSFSPYREHQDPSVGIYPSAEEIDADLALLQGKATHVRTYSSIDGLERIPDLAKRYGLKVTAGAWVDQRWQRNEEEIQNLIRNALFENNVTRLIVGNESILRGDLSVEQLSNYLRRVRTQSPVPVSTAEPWHVWLRYPQLANEVDYIAIHVLPYWENIPADQAMAWVIERYDMVRKAFPNKPIIFGEVGWPSGGHKFGAAKATQLSQARFIRQFANHAAKNHWDYFIMEAFDQPWKHTLEGSVGKYWGLYSKDRQPKFALTGDLLENPLWLPEAVLSAILASSTITLFLLYGYNLRRRGQLFFALLLQGVVSVFCWSLFVPFTQGLNLAGWLVWSLLFPAQLLLLAVVLINGFELTEMLWVHQLRRYFPPLPNHEGPHPKVSLHLAIHNEPPEMVRETLNALARLDYPNYEVLVIDNNTVDEAIWRPVEAQCARLGERFRFFHLPNWPGFKAGALNFALGETASDAEVVGVVDSDYIVDSDWLKSTMPYFAKPQVGFVQAPQDNREFRDDLFKTICNWEYNGFFRIGMVQRNERNAIIQHGTMTLIRRSALEQVGKWSEWTICEDAELGLRLFQSGYEAVYIDHDFGHGLTPDSFASYKGQRFRWAFGAVQILRHHWSSLWSLDQRLTWGQKFHFITGWLPWFADALHLVFSFAAMFWSIGLILWPQHFEFPLFAFLVPTLAVFAFKIIHALWLYRRKVRCSFWESVGAALAGMSLTHTLARAIFQALTSKSKPFFRTPKSENKPALMKGVLMAWEETRILALLWASAAAVVANYGTDHVEPLLWGLILAVQSVPYAAALLVSMSNSLPKLSQMTQDRTISLPAVVRFQPGQIGQA